MKNLYAMALKTVKPIKLKTQGKAGHVGCVLETVDNHFYDDSKLPPCGRCRELNSQLDDNNMETDILVDHHREMKLKELLPERWDKKWD